MADISGYLHAATSVLESVIRRIRLPNRFARGVSWVCLGLVIRLNFCGNYLLQLY
jgi:hypothetical protein